MKRAFIVFILVVIITAVIPLITFREGAKKSEGNELATIFQSLVILEQPCNLPLL